MRDVKCADCDNYKNEWCEKVMDSPYPDMLRDCQYFCEKRDLVEVVRCKDCKWRDKDYEQNCVAYNAFWELGDDGFCSLGERKEE